MPDQIKCRTDEERRGLDMFIAGYKTRGQTDQLYRGTVGREVTFLSFLLTIGSFFPLGLAAFGILLPFMVPGYEPPLPWYVFLIGVPIFWVMVSKATSIEDEKTKQRNERIEEEAKDVLDAEFEKMLLSIYRPNELTESAEGATDSEATKETDT